MVTDGRATQGAVVTGRAAQGAGTDPFVEARAAARLLAGTGVASVVVDCETGMVRLGLAAALAADLGAVAVRLDQLSADGLSGLVRDVRRAA